MIAVADNVVVAAFSLIGLMFASSMAYLATRINRTANVSWDTNQKVRSIEVTTEQTHKLVNSNMQAQLEINAIMARRMADLTKSAGDAAAATAAEKRLADHVAMQAAIDRQAAVAVVAVVQPTKSEDK